MTLKETIARLLGMSTPANGGTPASTARDNGTGAAAAAAAADHGTAPEIDTVPASDAIVSAGSDTDGAPAPDKDSGS